MKSSNQRTQREDKPGERVPLSLRVTAELKQKLDAAAEKSGRSQAQETELRLERSFEREELLSEALVLAYGEQAAGLILLLGTAMDMAGRFSHFAATRKHTSWVENPYAFDQAAQAALKLIEAARPAGDRKALGMAGKVPYAGTFGQSTANGLVWAVQGINDSLLGPEATERLRRLLGPVTKRLGEKST
jgi:predicted transcriptional regulator